MSKNSLMDKVWKLKALEGEYFIGKMSKDKKLMEDSIMKRIQVERQIQADVDRVMDIIDIRYNDINETYGIVYLYENNIKELKQILGKDGE